MAQNEGISTVRRILEALVPYLGEKRREGTRAHGIARDAGTLRRALPGWQIFLIAVGGVIGVTIFSTQGEILRLAGPSGLLMASVFVSVTMICVMECIGEFVVLWPVSNAMVEYVRYFVDEDLAIVIGIAYWYAWACVFATLITLAAQFGSYTIASSVGRGILFYAIIPVCLLLINVFGVEYYGLVEGVGGMVKLILVVVGIIFMIAEAPKAKTANLDDGFQHETVLANSNIAAVCMAIPAVAYGYIGTEIVAVTAFEALDRKSLRFPARFVSYIIASLYLISALLQCFLISWTNADLQSMVEKRTSPTLSKRDSSPLPPTWIPIIVIAAQEYSSIALGRFFTGCITYFCISAANTALYVASRTLFGLTRGLSRNTSVPFLLRPLRYFGMITPTRQVPLFALVFSAVSFYWLVPLQLLDKLETTRLLTIMGTTSSIAAITVWASQCVAFIRYYTWLGKFRDQLLLPPKYNRWDPKPENADWHKHRMLLSDFKLVPAVVGLVGCFFIVFIFSTANWWIDGHPSVTRVFTAFAGPIFLTAIFICLKLWNRRWWVQLPVTPERFAEVTQNLERNSNLRYVSATEAYVFETESTQPEVTETIPKVATIDGATRGATRV